MGLGPQLISDLIELKRGDKIPRGGRVVEIGAQQLTNGFLLAGDQLSELYGLFGKTPPDLGKPVATNNVAGVEQLSDAAPSSRVFWESLGFTYAAVEYAGHREAIALDLNRDSVPRHLQSSFDLVVNAGTTEHVANQDNAFKVIHDLAAVGGLMLHEVPAGGMLTHGVIGYNMQFFFLLCRDNDYEVLDLGLIYCGSAAMHPDILSSNAQFSKLSTHFNPTFCLPIDPDMGVPILAIRGVLQKAKNQPYFTPLDVPAELAVLPRQSKGKWGTWMPGHRLRRWLG
jgi:hypothetical protein